MAVVVLQSVWRGYLRHRFAWLFAALLFAIGVHPGVQMFAPEANFVAVVLAVSLIAAIASVAREPGFKALTALGAAFVVLQVVRAAIGGDVVSLIGEGVWIVTCLLALAALARQAVRRGAVDGERIFAALDAYLLAGLVFGVAYAILEQRWPEAFGSAAAIDLDLSGGIYFSFVTIATLGYGDIAPISQVARGLAILEAVAGQLYIAVLVARLVGLHTVSGSGGADR